MNLPPVSPAALALADALLAKYPGITTGMNLPSAVPETAEAERHYFRHEIAAFAQSTMAAHAVAHAPKARF